MCVQVNAGTVGVYRVQYSAEMLEQLIPAIRDKSLPPKDRLGLQNDLYALVCCVVRVTVEHPSDFFLPYCLYVFDENISLKSDTKSKLLK